MMKHPSLPLLSQHGILIRRLLKRCAATLLAASLAGCQSNAPSPVLGGGYASARAQSSLEIPPDLINQTTDRIRASAAQNTKAGSALLPAIQGIRVAGEGSASFLLVSASAEITWKKLQSFVDHERLPVLSESARDGVIETDWMGDDSTDTSTQKWLRKYLGKLASRPGLSDKYRFRLERVSDVETAVYLTHSQLTKQISDPKNRHDVTEVSWREQETDNARRQDMLRKLQAFLSEPGAG